MLLKSKKFWMVLIGTVLIAIVVYIGKQMNFPENIIQYAITIIAGLFGVEMIAHTVTDIKLNKDDK